MSIVVSHPTGNNNVRAVVKALEENKLLAEFDTAVAFNSRAVVLRFMPRCIRTELLRRTYPVQYSKVRCHPVRETARMLLPKIGFRRMVEHESGWASIDSVYRSVDRAVASRLSRLKNRGVRSVYAYEDGAYSTFDTAKRLGLKCIYDLPIAYWETGRKLMLEEAERLPEWSITLGGGIHDSAEKLDRKKQELKMADTVVVASKFVAESLPDWSKSKRLIMAPFGSPHGDSSSVKESLDKKGKMNKPLRVLFAGSLSQRKGLGDLFAAIKMLATPHVELVVMGALQASLAFYKSQLTNFTYEAGRPHDKVLELMRSCDVLCLPSIVEGRALVMQEAMSQGLPLIITANTGGEDLINEEDTGFLIPIRSPEGLANRIDWFLRNRQRVSEMGWLAKKHAANYSWERYGKTIMNSLP